MFGLNRFVALALVCIAPSSLLLSADTKPTLDREKDCGDEVLRSFFPKEFVDQVLQKHNVPKDKWDAIDKDLAQADKEVFKSIEAKNKELASDLRQDADARRQFIDYFRTTLTKSFGDVLKKYGITDENQIEEMLEEIQQLKLDRFEACYAEDNAGNTQR